MHLWPSQTLRNSFKREYLDNLDKNHQRMKNSKASQASTPLLSNKSDGVGEEEGPTKPNRFCDFCHDLCVLLTCWCCCLCNCDDEVLT